MCWGSPQPVDFRTNWIGSRYQDMKVTARKTTAWRCGARRRFGQSGTRPAVAGGAISRSRGAAGLAADLQRIAGQPQVTNWTGARELHRAGRTHVIEHPAGTAGAIEAGE